MTRRELAYFERKLEDLTGMRLKCFPPGIRRRYFQSRLRPRLKELGLTDYPDYRVHLQRLARRDPEWQSFADALRVGTTRFFRDRRELARLERLLPTLASKRELRAWSCGCSTGEEAYSLAMLLEAARRPYGLLATDISEEALAVARLGFYPRQRLARELPPAQRHWFVPPARRPGAALLGARARLRGRIEFARHDLLRSPLPMQDFDLIVCRNLLYYFDERAARRALDRLWRAARPGALLLVSRDDAIARASSRWRHVGGCLYRK